MDRIWDWLIHLLCCWACVITVACSSTQCHSTIAKVYTHSFLMSMFTHDNFTWTIQVDSVPCHDLTKEQFHWSKCTWLPHALPNVYSRVTPSAGNMYAWQEMPCTLATDCASVTVFITYPWQPLPWPNRLTLYLWCLCFLRVWLPGVGCSDVPHTYAPHIHIHMPVPSSTGDPYLSLQLQHSCSNLITSH